MNRLLIFLFLSATTRERSPYVLMLVSACILALTHPVGVQNSFIACGLHRKMKRRSGLKETIII